MDVKFILEMCKKGHHGNVLDWILQIWPQVLLQKSLTLS